MIMADWIPLMEKYNRLAAMAGITLFTCLNAAVAETPLSSADTTFTATINDGSCDWLWSETTINFPPVTVDRITAEKTLMIKPLTLSLQCTQPLTPQLKLTGNAPYSLVPSVFIDGTTQHNIGFMLQPDDGSQNLPALNDFYSTGIAGKALVNDIPFNLAPVADSQQVKHIIWVGLVGMPASQPTVPGNFSASLTFTGLIP